jgi:hypothetical protein
MMYSSLAMSSDGDEGVFDDAQCALSSWQIDARNTPRGVEAEEGHVAQQWQREKWSIFREMRCDGLRWVERPLKAGQGVGSTFWKG